MIGIRWSVGVKIVREKVREFFLFKYLRDDT